MAILKIKKMIACTADGGYSIMEKTQPMSEKICEKFIKRAFALQSEEIYQIKQLGKKRGITDVQRMQLLNKWRYEKFNDIAQEFGLEFRNHITPTDKSSGTDYNFFGVNPLEKLIDSLIIKLKK